MRCLYCGKQLALFKKLTGGGEFCSDAHKHKYHEEYNRLALNRLMEAQSRQEEQTPTRKLSEAPSSAPERSAFVEPTARGGYFRQTVSPRNVPMSGPAADACAPVGRAVELPVLTADTHDETEMAFAGLVMLPAAAHGAGQTALPALSEYPPVHAGAVVFPEFSCAPMGGKPELAEGAAIVDRRPRPGSNETPAMAPRGVSPLAMDRTARAIALPEFPLNPAGAASPETSGAAEAGRFEVRLAEPELLPEPAAVFQYFCEIPTSLDPGWARGLEFSAERMDVAPAPLDGAAGEAEAEPGPNGAEREPEDAGAVVEEPAEVVRVKAPEVLLGIAPATHEPVIDEAALRALFGGNDDPEPAPPAEGASTKGVPPAQRKEVPSTGAAEAGLAAKTETAPQAKSADGSGATPVGPPPRAAEAASTKGVPPAQRREAPSPGAAEAGLAAKTETAPQAKSADGSGATPVAPPAPVAEAALKAQAAAKPAASRNAASESREPLPFLEVSIRPAAPGKPRLMQSFQAISLVTAKPQIPAWNMLPLRPLMGFGREPGPGAALLERSRAQSGGETAKSAETAKSGQTATEAPPEETAMDLPVPGFAAAGKPKSGLSRWFKLGAMAGVLGLAGGYGAGNATARTVAPQRTIWSLQNAGNE